MMLLPPMMLRSRDEWPGQSTSVYWTSWYCCAARCGGGAEVEGGEAEVESDAALLRLRSLVERGRGEMRAESAGQARLAAVDVADDADVEAEHAPS